MFDYPNGFDAEMYYQLSEINPITLEAIKSNAFGVESNLLAKEEKMKTEKRVVFKEESSSSRDLKFDIKLKTMEKLVHRITPSRAENQPQVRNHNFRRPQGTQTDIREEKGTKD